MVFPTSHRYPSGSFHLTIESRRSVNQPRGFSLNATSPRRIIQSWCVSEPAAADDDDWFSFHLNTTTTTTSSNIVLVVLRVWDPADGDSRSGGGFNLGDVAPGDLHDAHVGGQHDEKGEGEAAQHEEEGEADLRHPHGVADGHGLGLEAVQAPATQRQPRHQQTQRPQGHQAHGQALRGHLRRVSVGREDV